VANVSEIRLVECFCSSPGMHFWIALLAWQSAPISPFVGSSVLFNPGLFFNGNFVDRAYPNPPFVSADVTNPLLSNCLGLKSSTPLECTTQNIVSKNLRNPFVHTASLGIQTQIRRDLLLEVSYIGSRGTRLFQRVDANPLETMELTGTTSAANPNRGFITEITNGGFSTYNALQVSATKRLREGSFWDSFVWSSAYSCVVLPSKTGHLR
jgi:hypothetical protein